MGLIGYNGGWGYGMMGGYGYGGILPVLLCSVWLIVGVLVAVWLWQHINKK